MDRIRAASQSLQAGDYLTAIRLYTEALKLDEHNYVLYGNRSAAYCRIGKFTKALQDAIKARELNPNWSKAYYRQGIAFQVTSILFIYFFSLVFIYLFIYFLLEFYFLYNLF
jgi:tetratricopeptide (TPR) repeat protein